MALGLIPLTFPGGSFGARGAGLPFDPVGVMLMQGSSTQSGWVSSQLSVSVSV